MSSPLHHPGPADIAWTRGNLGEALPGLCTPLSWTFFGSATEQGIRAGFYRIGALPRSEVPIPRGIGQRFVTPIYGWPAANIDMMARMAERLPGVDPAQVERELFGEERHVERHPTRRRYPTVAVRMPVTLIACLRKVRARRAAVERWWRDARARLDATGATDDVAQRVLSEAFPRFVEHMALHTIISMVASGLYEELAALTRESVCAVSPTRLVTGYGTLEEMVVADDLWMLSRHSLALDALLDRHGWHGINNGQLHNRVWREEPEHVRWLTERFHELPDDQRPSVRSARQRTERDQAESRLIASLPRVAVPRARVTLRLAQRFITHREVGKAGYLIAVDGARAAVRFLGRTWQRRGHLDDSEDVFLLTLDEVSAGPQGHWRELIDVRRSEQRRYQATVVPDAWVGTPEPIMAGDIVHTATDTNTPLSGVGVNPGIVEGVARVVLDPDDDFEPGEILVCATTDPSWVSVFMAAAAVVIDIGGHLSHGAIVARELGIPCVVNTRDGSRRIRSGDRLRVDGGTGQIAIVQPPTGKVT